MIGGNDIYGRINEKKALLVVAVVCLALIELEIFAVGVMKSGRKSQLQVMDPQGQVLYEADGNTLSDFDRRYFEKNFGPLDKYRVNLEVTEKPFPFRTWFAASAGIPVAVMLLLAFVVKAYAALFHGIPSPDETIDAFPGKPSRLESFFLRVSRFNVFVIGFLVLTTLVLFWMIPDALMFLGRISLETVLRYRWFFLGILVCFGGIVVWIIYLRYLLARRSIDAQTELDKYRLELEYGGDRGARRLIEQQRAGQLETGDRPPAIAISPSAAEEEFHSGNTNRETT